MVNNEAQHVYLEHWKMKALANINLFLKDEIIPNIVKD